MTRDDGYTRYTMRIPTDLYDRIKQAAGEKSVNAEVLGVLMKAYPPPRSAAKKRIANLIATIERISSYVDNHHAQIEAKLQNMGAPTEQEFKETMREIEETGLINRELERMIEELGAMRDSLEA